MRCCIIIMYSHPSNLGVSFVCSCLPLESYSYVADLGVHRALTRGSCHLIITPLECKLLWSEVRKPRQMKKLLTIPHSPSYILSMLTVKIYGRIYSSSVTRSPFQFGRGMDLYGCRSSCSGIILTIGS